MVDQLIEVDFELLTRCEKGLLEDMGVKNPLRIFRVKSHPVSDVWHISLENGIHLNMVLDRYQIKERTYWVSYNDVYDIAILIWHDNE